MLFLDIGADAKHLLFLCPSAYKFQSIEPAAVFPSAGNNINPRGVDAAVSQNICQLCDILVNGIETPGKKMPQIVWMCQV